MSVDVGWAMVPVSTSAKVPTLFYKFFKNDSGFVLIITDLVRLWKTARNKKEIFQQAAQDKTSIDPNEDPSQYDVLLSKLEVALTGSSHSTLSIRRARSGNADGFDMRASTPLPAPLRSLNWGFHLQLFRQEAFTKEIVLPLIYNQDGLYSQIASLKKIIDQKDSVITKLLDKIEGAAIDLSIVFPGSLRAGKKGLSAREAAKVVTGLSKFQENDWMNNAREQSYDETSIRGLISTYRHAYSKVEDLSARRPEIAVDDSSDWIKEIPSEYPDVSLMVLDEAKPRLTEQSDGDESEETASGDDDFERQDTPPGRLESRATNTPKRGPSKPLRSSSGSTQGVSSERSPLPKTTTKLGFLGGRRKQESVAEPKEMERISGRTSLTESSVAQILEKATDSDTGSGTDAGRESTRQQTTKAPESKRKLGAIGGKKARSDRPPTVDDVKPEDLSGPSKPRNKLGTIGGHKPRLRDRDASQMPTQEPLLREIEDLRPNRGKERSSTKEPAQRVATKQKEIAAVETEEEKADRKRCELRSQLEHAPAPKKKRKF